MTVARTVIIVLLIVLLAVDLAAANTVIAADRTVLNAGFVTTALDEADAYDAVEPIVLDTMALDF